jgi:hypothetical protein
LIQIFLIVFDKKLPTDDFAKDVFAHLGPSDLSCSTFPRLSQHYKEFKWQDNSLFYKNLLYVLDGSSRLQMLEHCHDAHMAGHFGICQDHGASEAIILVASFTTIH